MESISSKWQKELTTIVGIALSRIYLHCSITTRTFCPTICWWGWVVTKSHSWLSSPITRWWTCIPMTPVSPVTIHLDNEYILFFIWYQKLSYFECYENVQTIKNYTLPGHSSMLQVSCIVVSPSQAPPFASSTFFVLIRVLLPIAHVLEQSLICHWFHSQSMVAT